MPAGDSPMTAVSQDGLPTRELGINVIGNVTSNTGLGVHARNMIRVLQARGVPISVFDVDPGLGRAGRDATFAAYRVQTPDELPHRINFFVLHPPSLFSLAAAFPDAFVRTANLNVGLLLWELGTLPATWIPGLAVLDVIGAATHFVASAASSMLEGPPTISIPCPLHLPERVVPSRPRFGLPDQATLFVLSFEPNSDMRRKNPFAAIEAFRRAFDGKGPQQLIVKLNNAAGQGGAHPAVAELSALCDGRPDIRIIDQSLAYQDVLSLYASCDAFVSLHRAEGLGLGLMEAMALGKPVIATAWSGNMTFMDHANACLVGYELVPVDGSLPVYRRAFLGEGARWADPRVDEAAAWMKTLAGDVHLRSSIGAKAKADMARHHESAMRGHFVDEIRAIAEQRSFLRKRQARLTLPIGQLWDAADTRAATTAAKFRRQLQRMAQRRVLWRFRRGHSTPDVD